MGAEKDRLIFPAECGPEIRHIFEGHLFLLTEVETSAYKRLLFTEKARGSRDKVAAMIRSRWIVDDPEVDRLVSKGEESFYQQVRDRIMQAESRGEITLNRCPKCGTLTRTPTACLCPACNHTWYEKRAQPAG